MKTTAEQFKKLLPTLQHLARFPGCNRTLIAKSDGLDLAEVEGVIAAECGALSLWDETALADAAKRLRVRVPKWRPKPHPAPAPVPSPAKLLAPAAPVAIAKVTEDPPVAGALTIKGKPIKVRFRRVMEVLAGDEKISELQAAERCGLGGSTWAYFKKTRLGAGPVDRAQVRALLAGTAVGPAPVAAAAAPVARRKFVRRKTVAEPAAAPAVAVTVSQGEPGVLERVNAILAGFRLEVVAVRLVGPEKGGA